MKLKHLEKEIHLLHTSKYHPDATDIHRLIEKTALVDKLHYVRKCVRKKVRRWIRSKNCVNVSLEGRCTDD